jgi:hypothetical protein
MSTQSKWRVSSYSGAQGNCVEVLIQTTTTAVRNSNHPDREALAVDNDAMRAFVEECAAGMFDDHTA